MVLHLRSCCCGCSLKTGTQIIGWQSAVCAFLVLVIGVMGMTGVALAVQKGDEEPLQPTTTPTPDDDALKHILENKTLFIGLLVFLIVLSLVQLILSILLLHGTNNNRPELIKPWIIYCIIGFTIEAITYLVHIIYCFIVGYIVLGLLELFVVPCVFSIGIYYILVVNSFRNELISRNLSRKT